MDIYKLFKKEKKIVISDNSGNSMDLILVKPNIGDDEKIARAMEKARDEAVDEIKNSSSTTSDIENIIASMNLEEKHEYILSNEEPFQRNRVDIAPIGDRKEMTDKEIEEKEEEFIKLWKSKRKEELKTLKDEELNSRIVNTIIDIKSILRSGEVYNRHILLHAVRDSNYKKIFKTVDDVSKLDRNTFRKLITETNDFINSLSSQDVRKGADDKSFLSSGESEKSSEDSQPIAE